MGTRSKRIRGRDLSQVAPELIDQRAQVITWSGHTYLGKIISTEPGWLVLRDPNAYWYNRRKHTHRLAWDEIREVVIDQVSEW